MARSSIPFACRKHCGWVPATNVQSNGGDCSCGDDQGDDGTLAASIVGICGGSNDIFMRTSINMLVRARKLPKINVLLCGPVKTIDSTIVRTLNAPCVGAAGSKTARKSIIGKNDCLQPPCIVHESIVSPEKKTTVFFRHQTNMPSEAQWRGLQPDIIAIGAHCFTQRWCAKNLTDSHSWPEDLSENADGDFAAEFSPPQPDMYDADQESDDGDDSSSNNSNNVPAAAQTKRTTLPTKRKRRPTTRSQTPPSARARPTLHRTELFRRLMLAHCAKLIAKHRPKMVLIQCIEAQSKQPLRNTRGRQAWQRMLNLFIAFGNECGYRITPFGLEMYPEEEDDDAPASRAASRTTDLANAVVKETSDPGTSCNAILMERIDNGYTATSDVYKSTILEDERAEEVCAAARWLFPKAKTDAATDKPLRAKTVKAAKTTKADATAENRAKAATTFDAYNSNTVLIPSLAASRSIDGKIGLTTSSNMGSMAEKESQPKRRKKSATKPCQVYFPHAYAVAAAHYVVAQAVASKEE